MDGRLLAAAAARGVFVLFVAVGAAVAGDAGLAKFLLDAGKVDLQKGDLAGAVTKLEKARVEDPDLLEVLWVLGQVREKQAAGSEALRAFRDLLDGIDRKEKAATATKDESALRKRASARVEALGAGEKELRTAREAFVKGLLAFAKERAEKDKTIAARALRLLLEEDPSHAEAAQMLARLGAPAEAARPPESPATPAAPATPYPGITRWTDMIREKTLGFDEDWTYREDGVLAISKKGGTLTRPKDAIESGDRFAFEMEVRVTEELERGWAVGLEFAAEGQDFLTAILLKSEIVLEQQRQGIRHDVGQADVKPIEIGTWHRLAVVVGEGKVQVWLDGKKALDATPTDAGTLAGDVGLFHQRCTAEFRVLRLGRPQ